MAILHSRLILDTNEQKKISGPKNPCGKISRITGRILNILARTPRLMVLFKSVGTAVQDAMSGFAVYEEAVRQGRGQDISEFLELKMF